MKAEPQGRSIRQVTTDEGDGWGRAFAGLYGLFLALSLLKFGNPVVLDHLIEVPRNLEEWRVFAWPVRFGWMGFGCVAAIGCMVLLRNWSRPEPLWVGFFGIGWLVWQFLALPTSVAPGVSNGVVIHFTICLGCFLLGWMALGRVTESRVFWLCLVLGFCGVLGVAGDQRFGGLEATRKMILENNAGAPMSPEYLARIQSNRVFGTLVYPNALAGVILLLLPCSSFLVRDFCLRWGRQKAHLLTGCWLLLGLSVLVWSGSKAGWLLVMMMMMVVLFHLELSRRLRLLLAATVVVSGLAAFGYLYAEKLRKGPTSVVARVEYWKAAVQGFRAHPWLGLGPGGFKSYYSKVKPADAEMAQLAHNDFLQQAADSGIPGFVGYLVFIVGSLAWLYRQRNKLDWFSQWVGLGVAGWFVQGLVEFGLYIPAASWCAFTLLGWLLAQRPSTSGGGSVAFR
ncbi:MAG: O-antigen ligase family protein [Verrucomicrobiales bacterium]|nr:O-antigen ligase family protein [Verrucomicrobiales bacterium]